MRASPLLALIFFAHDFSIDRGQSTSVRNRDVTVREVTFTGPSGEPTEATLVAPASRGPHPAVLFVHWYGPEHTNSNRTQYVPDALLLAEQGITSLLVDTPWSEPGWFPKRNPDDDIAFSTGMVKRLRRALDVLAALDGVDATRLALVGHDFGAMFGAVAAALEPRVSAFAFVAGTARFADWFTLGRKLDADAKAAVYAGLAPFDPVTHLPKVKARTVLLQFAKKDPYVSQEAAEALIASVSAPKESKFYDTGHEMNREALDDRVAWLVRVLGRQAASPAAQSNSRARAAVARAVEAHGGEAAIRDIKSIWLEEEGTSYMRGQSPLPGRPFAARPYGQRVMIDLSDDRGCHAPGPFTHSSTTKVEDMWYLWHPRTIVADGQVTTLDLRTRSRSAPRPGSLQALQAQRRLLPTTWLVDALDNAQTLQWLGETGSPATTLVGMTGSDGRAVTLRIGADGLIAGIERLTTDPAEGDAVSSTSFEGYRRVAGVLLPARRISRVGDDIVSDMRVLRLRINEGIDQSCFEIPGGFTTSMPAVRPTTAAVRLADGVYLLQSLGDAYNALAVLFSDHVLVVEAPEHESPSGLSASALRMVASFSGGRPVRYLAFTHYHVDHGGGLREYIAEGATVLTTAGTKRWVEEAANARFEIKPDRLARAPRPVSVEVIGDRSVREDSVQRVEFHMVPWDHAQEELVVYLPKAKLLFEGDLFASGNGDAPIAQKSAELLRDLIRDRGLAVDTIVGVHGKPRPTADLAAALERRERLLRLN